MDVSIIVPLYNEEQNVAPLYRALKQVMDSSQWEYELLLVDDGSIDRTFFEASHLAEHDRNLRIIKFRKNCGQTPAMVAGIDQSRGKVLITMDGDLQNDPVDIPRFIQKIDEGYDIVVGWRHQRQDKFVTRKLPSRVANWLIGKVTGVPIKDNGCSLKAYKADVIKNVPLYSEMHRFIPAMASVTGARIAEIKVKHHPRRFGVSKYGLSRVYKVLLDLLTVKTLISFTHRPLLWFGLLSVPPALLSLTLLLTTTYHAFVEPSSLSIPLAGTAVLSGALATILFLSGILGEVIYKTGNLNMAQLPLLTIGVATTSIEQDPAGDD
jgi:glycosyltransferase involved in cell wall biosynthesis